MRKRELNAHCAAPCGCPSVSRPSFLVAMLNPSALAFVLLVDKRLCLTLPPRGHAMALCICPCGRSLEMDYSVNSRAWTCQSAMYVGDGEILPRCSSLAINSNGRFKYVVLECAKLGGTLRFALLKRPCSGFRQGAKDFGGRDRKIKATDVPHNMNRQ